MAANGTRAILKIICGLTIFFLLVYWKSAYAFEQDSRLRNMLDACVKSSYRIMDSVEYIKQDNLNTPGYEIGYINFIIMEKYRRIVDKYNISSVNMKLNYLVENMLFLEDIERHYFEIEHLSNMLHEIERKYNVTTDLDTLYYEKTKKELEAGDDIYQSSSKDKKGKGEKGGKGGSGHGSGDDDRDKVVNGTTRDPRELRPPTTRTPRYDKGKKKRLKLYKYDIDTYIFNKLNPTTTPRPTPTWPLEYGWEIDYHW
ncbi:uncharacterized protein LOC118281255 isoform X3 [Spodoptera frugiperda]|uniref:Uncharacterized protein LOC118281255 isoform X3 n=1 Tax=Spodoptera frugiperda TaxID=7108 RepID=A0A9R0E0P6_SPOFR|nr:uncharacterized protein LOC118281255 isoform X3 [Spodoptera frugiperda]